MQLKYKSMSKIGTQRRKKRWTFLLIVDFVVNKGANAPRSLHQFVASTRGDTSQYEVPNWIDPLWPHISLIGMAKRAT